MADLDAELVTALIADQHPPEAPITIVLRPLAALQLARLLQLVLRHPDAPHAPGHWLAAVTFIEHVRHAFADAPAALAVLRQGDDPADQEPRR